MRTRVDIVLTCIALMIQGATWADELHVDFRHKGFDNDALQLVGLEAEQLVKPGERGLFLRIPPNEGIVGPVGLAPRKMIRGDFEIVAEFELLRYDRPREGSGAGVVLEVEFPTAPIGPITLGRLAIPAGGDWFTWASPRSTVGNAGLGMSQVQARSRTGKLRLSRTGSTIRADCADGDRAFVLLRKQDVGAAEARITWLGVQTGSSSCRAEALLKSLTIRAEEWFEPTVTQARPTFESGPWFFSIFLGFAAVLLALATWKRYPAALSNLAKGRVR
ncbi:DUF1583 domain-containing protein [Singulisphaera rosea]